MIRRLKKKFIFECRGTLSIPGTNCQYINQCHAYFCKFIAKRVDNHRVVIGSNLKASQKLPFQYLRLKKLETIVGGNSSSLIFIVCF